MTLALYEKPGLFLYSGTRRALQFLIDGLSAFAYYAWFLVAVSIFVVASDLTDVAAPLPVDAILYSAMTAALLGVGIGIWRINLPLVCVALAVFAGAFFLEIQLTLYYF